MSLRFVAGSSGAGKSYTVYEELIRRSLEHPEKQFLVIVPDQFTMQTQKELVQMHPHHGMLNMDVLSFSRLAWRVFEEVGGNTLPVLEDTGKSLVIQRVAAARKEDLQLLGKTLSRPGGISEMKSLISELLQYRVRPADMDDWIREQKGSRLGRKLMDVQTIFSAFQDYLEEHYLTAEELPGVLCGVIQKSSLVRDSEIVLDGFTGFTPVQNQVVRELMALADRVTVIVTMDPAEDFFKRDGMHRLFHMSHEMVHHLMELARETHTECEPVQWVKADGRGRFSQSPALDFLEKNLFRYRTAAYRGLPEEIRITEAADPHKEILGVVQEIRRLVREEGYRYRDIAVVTGDLGTYGQEIADQLELMDINAFLDRKQPVMVNPLVEFIRSALDMNAQNYSYDSVFRFLRSGLTDFTPAEVDELETYCRALGIRGRKKYEETWTRLPSGKRKEDPDKLLFYQDLQKRFVALTADLHKGMHERNSTVLRKSEVLYLFLKANRVQEKLEEYGKHFRELDKPTREKEFTQIYGVVLELLDKIVELLGDEKIRLADYQAILDAGFQETAIGLIPPGEDQVMIGDIERTRLKKIRVQFFVGVNEGIVPKAAASKGILSEFDRECIQTGGRELSPTAREQMYQQRFYLYLNMTKPSDRLYLSYARMDKGGSSLLPSYLIGVLRKLYPDMKVKVQDREETLKERLETPKGTRDFLLEGILRTAEGSAFVGEEEEGTDAAFAEMVREMYRAEADRAQIDRLFEAALTENRKKGLGSELARRLYGDTFRASVSRLERFAGCAFRHFLDYGLRLKEREEYSFEAVDFGTVMHEALDLYSRRVESEGLKWGLIPEEKRNALADQALQDVVLSYNNHILLSSERNGHMIERIRQILHRTVWALDVQIAGGDFLPEDFEFHFHGDKELEAVSFTLADGRKVELDGQIDRLDVCDADGSHYVKIVDYKTGTKRLNLNSLFNGQQLQLAVYMNAAIESEKKKHPTGAVEPAGILYYNIQDPILEEKEVEAALSPEDAILSELRPNGRLRSEAHILNLLDRDLNAGDTSRIIPVKLKKDGNPDSYSQVSDSGDFDLIGRFAAYKVKALAGAIADGEIAVEPTAGEGGKDITCEWCVYRSVCGFDPRIPGCNYRVYPRMKEGEVLQAMKKSLSDEEMRQAVRAAIGEDKTIGEGPSNSGEMGQNAFIFDNLPAMENTRENTDKGKEGR